MSEGIPDAGKLAVDVFGKAAIAGPTPCGTRVVVYDLAGHLAWTRELAAAGCAGSVTVQAMTYGSHGELILAGTFAGTVDFGAGPVTASSRAPFLLDLAP